MYKKSVANALRYNSEDDTAPKVIAKGIGFTADKIKEMAKEHGIPIIQSPGIIYAYYPSPA